MTSLQGNDGLRPLACQVSQGQSEDHPCVALLKTLIRARKASTSPLLMASVSAVFLGVSSDLRDSIFSGASSHLGHIFRLGSIPGMSCKEFNYSYIKHYPLGTKPFQPGPPPVPGDRAACQLMSPEGCWSWWPHMASLGTALRACACPCSQEQLVCRCALLPAQHQHLGEWHTAALRHPCLERSPGSCSKTPPLLCSCSCYPISHRLCTSSTRIPEAQTIPVPCSSSGSS